MGDTIVKCLLLAMAAAIAGAALDLFNSDRPEKGKTLASFTWGGLFVGSMWFIGYWVIQAVNHLVDGDEPQPRG